METAQIDLLTVLIAAILNMVIGFFWYSKWLFGPTWMRKHFDKEVVKTKKISFLYGLITSLITAYFLAFFQAYLGVTTVSDGMFVGFCIWLGFVATTQIAPVFWEKRSFREFSVHTGCRLLSYLVMSGVIGA